MCKHLHTAACRVRDSNCKKKTKKKTTCLRFGTRFFYSLVVFFPSFPTQTDKASKREDETTVVVRFPSYLMNSSLISSCCPAGQLIYSQDPQFYSLHLSSILTVRQLLSLFASLTVSPLCVTEEQGRGGGHANHATMCTSYTQTKKKERKSLGDLTRKKRRSSPSYSFI